MTKSKVFENSFKLRTNEYDTFVLQNRVNDLSSSFYLGHPVDINALYSHQTLLVRKYRWRQQFFSNYPPDALRAAWALIRTIKILHIAKALHYSKMRRAESPLKLRSFGAKPPRPRSSSETVKLVKLTRFPRLARRLRVLLTLRNDF